MRGQTVILTVSVYKSISLPVRCDSKVLTVILSSLINIYKFFGVPLCCRGDQISRLSKSTQIFCNFAQLC